MTDSGALPERIGGRYEVRDCIGSGGAATVYRVYDPVLRVTRALKLLHGQTGPVQQARLEQEARIMVRLDHPHVLRVHELGTDQGRAFVVMDLADGSLQDRLERTGPLRPSEVIGVGIQLLSALSAAHAAGVIHRDIKPQNLLFCRGRVVLADFGIASVTDNESVHTRTGMMMGSMAYMPPEQRLDARAAGPRSDLYAVGSTLYALLTGGNPIDLFAAPPSSPRWLGIPPPLLPILQRACAYEPAERYADAAELAEALKQVAPLVGELPAGPWPEVLPTDALPRQPTSIVVPPSPTPEGRRPGWFLVPLLLLVLVGAGQVFFWGADSPDTPVVTEAPVVPPVVQPPPPAAAAVPPPAPTIVADSVSKTTKKSTNSVSCSTPKAFRGSWVLSCGTGTGQLLLGEKSCAVVLRGERRSLRAEEEGADLRLWVGDSDSESFVFTTPEEGRHLDGPELEQCYLTRSAVGTWTGSYRGQAATLVLKSGSGDQVKGTMTVAPPRGGPGEGKGTSVKSEVTGSFDRKAGKLLLEDTCTASDCGQYAATVNGARMTGTMKPGLGREVTFSMALP